LLVSRGVDAAPAERRGAILLFSALTRRLPAGRAAVAFESQAMRFESNGYPADYIYTVEYDSTFSVETRQDVWTRMDRVIATAKAKTGDSQVDLIGHSRGAEMSYSYVESAPLRAQNVARFINLDSGSSPKDRLPAGIPSLGIWAGRGHCAGCRVVGATNVDIPNQTHVQLATSAEHSSMYKYSRARSRRLGTSCRCTRFPSSYPAGS
jgi:hypothetical protein